MRKIAIDREAASILLPGQGHDGSPDLRVFSNLPGQALKNLAARSSEKELRFIISPDDGKMWVWDSMGGWIHAEVMEDIGYEKAICGYIKLEGDALQVSWYSGVSDAWGDHTSYGAAYPQKYPAFKRAFSDPHLKLVGQPVSDYGYSQPWEDVRGREYLDPADVGRIDA